MSYKNGFIQVDHDGCLKQMRVCIMKQTISLKQMSAHEDTNCISHTDVLYIKETDADFMGTELFTSHGYVIQFTYIKCLPKPDVYDIQSHL